MNSDTLRSIPNYDVFINFPQMEIGLVESWDAEAAHTRTKLDLPLPHVGVMVGAVNVVVSYFLIEIIYIYMRI